MLETGPDVFNGIVKLLQLLRGLSFIAGILDCLIQCFLLVGINLKDFLSDLGILGELGNLCKDLGFLVLRALEETCELALG